MNGLNPLDVFFCSASHCKWSCHTLQDHVAFSALHLNNITHFKALSVVFAQFNPSVSKFTCRRSAVHFKSCALWTQISDPTDSHTSDHSPSSTSSAEIALPIPDPPPVTIATLWLNKPGLKTLDAAILASRADAPCWTLWWHSLLLLPPSGSKLTVNSFFSTHRNF